MTDNSMIEGEYIVEKHSTHDGWVFPVVKRKLIHCRDCKHRMHDGTCIKVMKRKPDDGFCDEGERNV